MQKLLSADLPARHKLSLCLGMPTSPTTSVADQSFTGCPSKFWTDYWIASESPEFAWTPGRTRFLLSSWWTPFGFPNLRGFIWREKMAFFSRGQRRLTFVTRLEFFSPLELEKKALPFFDHFHSHANVYHSSSQDRRVIDDCEFASWLLSKKNSLPWHHSIAVGFIFFLLHYQACLVLLIVPYSQLNGKVRFCTPNCVRKLRIMWIFY